MRCACVKIPVNKQVTCAKVAPITNDILNIHILMTHLLGHGGECSKTKLVSTSMRSKAVDQKHVTKNARNADRLQLQLF